MTTPPAITFDPAAFRTWCSAPAPNPPDTNAEWHGLTGAYDSLDVNESAAARVEGLLTNALHETPAIWHAAPGVGDVRIYCTTDAEGAAAGDGGGVVTVTTDGVELFAGYLGAGDLVAGTPDDYDYATGGLRLPVIEAMAEALTHVAEAVNRAVEGFRAARGERS